MWTQLLNDMLHRLIQSGALEVTYADGSTHRFGQASGEPIRLQLHKADLPRKLIFNPDLAVGEAYMDGDLTIGGDDIRGFLALILINRGLGHDHWTIQLNHAFRWVMRRLQQSNPIGKAQSNVAHHYDLSADLYDLFLDEDKQYSCAYFKTPDDTLEQAQAQKKAHIARKLRIEPGMKVLDIGCGWGGMGLTLARDFGAQVVGVTLSTEQHKIARERAAAAGLSDQVDFRLTDYRAINERFDRIVSVGMFEHVGVPHYREYFRHVREKLTDDGIALIHTIGRASPPGTTSPWVLKYIFPGGYVPAMSEMSAAVEKERLFVTDLEVWRMHYAETLLHWYNRFEARIEDARALYDDRFCRMWRYYLAASEMTFRHHHQIVFQYQLARRQDAVPLTRDYLYDT